MFKFLVILFVIKRWVVHTFLWTVKAFRLIHAERKPKHFQSFNSPHSIQEFLISFLSKFLKKQYYLLLSPKHELDFLRELYIWHLKILWKIYQWRKPNKFVRTLFKQNIGIPAEMDPDPFSKIFSSFSRIFLNLSLLKILFYWDPKRVCICYDTYKFKNSYSYFPFVWRWYHMVLLTFPIISP